MPAGGNAVAQITADSARELVVADLSTTLFASFARQDQRRKGGEYLRGLLRASGRKSIRNIAHAVGGQATEQYLHHFINDSTWDWKPVRRALGRYVRDVTAPEAWVVRPMVIPKTGKHSVGVGRRFCPDRGQTLNAQQAMGVWAASDELSVPVDWRLHLSQAWLREIGSRSRPALPDGVRAEPETECAVEAFLDTAARPDFPDLPVVVEVPRIDVATVVARLHPRSPLLVRIGGGQLLRPVDPTASRRSGEPRPAHHIMTAARVARKPVASRVPLLAATVPVRIADAVGRPVDLVLLGVGPASRSWPAALWLSNRPDVDVATLAHLARLADRVDHDFARFADPVGVRDFIGRSFAGWHRHVTLASAAHAVSGLTDTAPARRVG